jgi:hypothetical protein
MEHRPHPPHPQPKPKPQPQPQPSQGTDITMAATITLGIVFVVSLLFIITGDIFSFIVVVLLIGILCFVLINFGFVKINTLNNQIDIVYNPVPDPPAGPTGADGASSAAGSPPPSSDIPSGNEVFYVGDNTFTYDKAENVCRAYDAELATYSQIEQAYNAGAEWCGYGWSVGGLALFPTQQASWERRQMNETSEAKRQLCGRPGINGGYFDPSMKFGVNCYGRKPAKKPTDGKKPAQSSAADRMIGFLRDNLDSLKVLPFNNSSWSESEGGAVGGNIVDSQTKTEAQAPVAPTLSHHTAGIVRGTGRAAIQGVQGVGSGALQFVKDLFQE